MGFFRRRGKPSEGHSPAPERPEAPGESRGNRGNSRNGGNGSFLALPDPSRAFALAVPALDLEGLLDATAMPSEAEVDGHVARLALLETRDPGHYGPQAGLMLAVSAVWRLARGDGPEAWTAAEAGVAKLLRFTNQPRRIQAALVFALLLKGRAGRAVGRAGDALAADQRAAAIAAAMQPPLTPAQPAAGKPAAPESPVGCPAATDPPTAADSLVNEGIALTQQGDHRAAVRAFDRAIAVTTGLGEAATPRSERALFVARWRRAMSLLMLDDPAALPEAHRTIALGRLRLAGPRGDSEDLAVTALMAYDMAKILFAAGLTNEGLDLLGEADGWCRYREDPRVMRSRALVLHSRAAARWEVLSKPGSSREVGIEPLEDLAARITEAVRLRRLLRDPRDPLTLFELADSLRLLAQGCVLVGRNAQIADAVGEAYDQIRPLARDEDVERLRAQLAELVRLLERVAPAELAAERASGRIPW